MDRFQNRFGCVILLGLMATLTSFLLTCLFGGAAWGKTIRFPALEAILMGGGLVGPLAATGIIGWLTYRWGRRDWRNVCPHCQEMLTGLVSVVVTTGRCFHCGRRALEEPEPDDQPLPPPAHPLLSTSEFAARLAGVRRVNGQAWLRFFVVVGVLLVPVVLPEAIWGSRETEFRLARLLKDNTLAYDLMNGGVVIWVLCSLAVALVTAIIFAVRRYRRCSLKCPYCLRGHVLPELVLASRRCDHCQEVVIGESPTERPGEAGS